MSSNVTTDLSKFDDAIKKLAKEVQIKVGVFAGATNNHGKKPVEVLQYAVANEFGTKDIPPRPFLRTVNKKENQDIWQRIATSELRKGKDVYASASSVADTAVAMVKKNIRDGNWKPNKDSTVKYKQKKHRTLKPLIDTGTLLDSISYEVNKK